MHGSDKEAQGGDHVSHHVQIKIGPNLWESCGCQQHHEYEDAMSHAQKHIGDGSVVCVVTHDKDGRRIIEWESGEAA